MLSENNNQHNHTNEDASNVNNNYYNASFGYKRFNNFVKNVFSANFMNLRKKLEEKTLVLLEDLKINQKDDYEIDFDVKYMDQYILDYMFAMYDTNEIASFFEREYDDPLFDLNDIIRENRIFEELFEEIKLFQRSIMGDDADKLIVSSSKFQNLGEYYELTFMCQNFDSDVHFGFVGDIVVRVKNTLRKK
jgi:hypothetical protein